MCGEKCNSSMNLTRGVGVAVVPPGQEQVHGEVGCVRKRRVLMLQQSFFSGCKPQEPLPVMVLGCASNHLDIPTSITRDWLHLPAGHKFIPGKQTSIFHLERGIRSS